MKKIILLLPLLFCAVLVRGQEKGEKEGDLEYEMKHRSQPWFLQMKDGANYFEVKRNFDQYFGTRKWETSKARQLGVSWLKTKLFYLDANGMVQPAPLTNPKANYITANQIAKTTTRKNGSWNLIGPVNSLVGGGYSGGGNHGGYVYLNRIDPTNTKKMFVSFLTGGLWMTIDGGKAWTLVDANMPAELYRDLDVAISDPKVVYAISPSHVIKSTDGGLNWQPTALTRTTRDPKLWPGLNTGNQAGDIAVSTGNPDIVVARWGGSIYRTTDGGTTWSAVLAGALSNPRHHDGSITAEMLDWSTTDPKVVYSVSTGYRNSFEVHRSGDSGATFTKIATITLDAKGNGQVIAWVKLMLPANNKKSIYVAVGSGASSRAHHAVHLYKLNATTGAIEDKKINMLSGKGNIYAHAPVLHHGDIAMDRNDEKKIAWGSYGNSRISVSEDGGKTFKLSTNTCHVDIRALDYVNGEILVGSDGEAVVFSKGGKAMRRVSNSISNHELWGFGSAFKTNLVATGNNHGPLMIKEAKGDIEWYNGMGADQGNTDVNPLDDRYIYSNGYGYYNVFRTGVHTLRWDRNSFLDLGGIYSYFNSVEFHPNLYYTLITHHAGGSPSGNPNRATWKKSLIRTDDNGKSIYIVKTFDREVFREKISMKNPDHIYVVEGKSNNSLWHTADGGKTWKNITPPRSVTTLRHKNISDIAVSDENPGEVWATYSGVQSECKVVKSSDYGATWTNLTEAKLTKFPMTKIIFQRGSDGGVYVGNRSGIYYRNNKMDSWKELGTGLPMADIRFMFINYNENKLKIGTSRGAFSHELHEISPPNALISASTNKLLPSGNKKVQFKDYSVVRNASATWKWSFPGGTPATSTEENPEISYENAKNGVYDVTLTVTDKYGTSTQTLPNFIRVFGKKARSSTPEPSAGNVASLSGVEHKDYIHLDKLELNRNSFTFSCWIKPKGIQENNSSLFNVQDKKTAFGLHFSGGNNTLGLYTGSEWSSGLQVPADQWSYVVLVSDGEKVKLYVNGRERVHNTGLSPQAITKIDLGRFGRSHTTSRYTQLEMDEVCLWNRSLTTDEIRKWRHLTKMNTSSPIMNGLAGYYQFNEEEGNISPNKGTAKGFAIYRGVSATNHLPSKAPVFNGKSQKLTINSAGNKDFSEAGVALEFGSGTYPDGEVWVFRSNNPPDVLPDNKGEFIAYAIINNYGTNPTFSGLKSMRFTAEKSSYHKPNSRYYNLYRREANAFGTTWGAKLGWADEVSPLGSDENNITFSKGLSESALGQFMVNYKKTGLITGVENQAEPKVIPIIYPNPLDKGKFLSVETPARWAGATMVIYDTEGKKVAQMTLTSGKNSVKINTSAGLHHVTIFNANHKHVSKIMLK